jgi:hypothetical protein
LSLRSEATEYFEALVSWILPTDRRLRVVGILLIGGVIAALAIIGPFGSSGLLQAGMEYATFPMQVARIEVIREALKQVPCGVEGVAFQGIIVQAITWNERIAHEHEANMHWYSDPFSPDWWLDLELLMLPDCNERD